mgnify:CR=1 FL=1
MNLNKRDQKEILEYLKHIASELTDAYNSTPDTSENSDALYFIDTARDLVDELAINVEDNQEVPVPHEDLRKKKVSVDLRTLRRLINDLRKNIHTKLYDSSKGLRLSFEKPDYVGTIRRMWLSKQLY